jgi:hypothetical protein
MSSAFWRLAGCAISEVEPRSSRILLAKFSQQHKIKNTNTISVEAVSHYVAKLFGGIGPWTVSSLFRKKRDVSHIHTESVTCARASTLGYLYSSRDAEGNRSFHLSRRKEQNPHDDCGRGAGFGGRISTVLFF